MDVDLPICATCGVQYPAPRDDCPICLDERQYVGWDGQRWTTLAELAAAGHRGVIKEEGPGVLGGGVQHIEVKPGLYSITAQTNWAPWSNYPAAQRAWRKAADALCGKGKYQELGISQAAKDTGMPHFLRAAAYIVTERRGYALCNDSQITFADAAVLIDKAQNDAARHD